jgi:hypothetical protein
VEEGYERAWTCLESNKETLTHLAEGLLEYETLDSWEIDMIVKGQHLAKPKPAPAPDAEGSPVKEKTTSPHGPLPQLINPKGKPAPA